MRDFPNSLIDFQRRFPDEAACAVWLFECKFACNNDPLKGLFASNTDPL